MTPRGYVVIVTLGFSSKIDISRWAGTAKKELSPAMTPLLMSTRHIGIAETPCVDVHGVSHLVEKKEKKKKERTTPLYREA